MRFFLALVILLTALTGFAQKANTWIKASTKNFSIQVPKNWSTDTVQVQKTIFKAKAPLDNSEDDFMENLGVRKLEDADPENVTSIETLVDGIEKQLGHSLKEFRLIEKKEITCSRKKAIQLIFNSQYEEYSITQIQVYQLRGGDFYIFTFSAKEDVFARYQPIFNKIIESIQFR